MFPFDNAKVEPCHEVQSTTQTSGPIPLHPHHTCRTAIIYYHKNSKVGYKFSTDNLASVAWRFHYYNITHFLLTHTRNGKFLSVHLALLDKYYLSATLQMTTFLCFSIFSFPLKYMYFSHPSPPTSNSPYVSTTYPYLHVFRTCL